MTGNGRQPARSTPPLVPGAPAPPFDLPDSPYSRLSLDDFAGRTVVLVFYVADWHPVAAAQLARYQERLPELARRGAAVIGISTDATWSHGEFARSLGITFPLLADDLPPGAVARAYGVRAPGAGRSRRALFVIDESRVVRWSAVFPDPIDPGIDGVIGALDRLAAAGAASSKRGGDM